MHQLVNRLTKPVEQLSFTAHCELSLAAGRKLEDSADEPATCNVVNGEKS